MTSLIDHEFGEIQVRKRANSRQISITVSTKGVLLANAPTRTPNLAIKAVIASSREKIRQLLKNDRLGSIYYKDTPIGKEHYLTFVQTDGSSVVKIEGSRIVAYVSKADDIESYQIQRLIKDKVTLALRKEAKNYLPKRISILASQHNLSYSNLRFTHASSRWGSCSSAKTISLNIALMKLPFEIIDYVLCHELSHLVHMNHSKQFWNHVENMNPNYSKHRNALKRYAPHI